jgi:hypothetical protein
LRRRRVACRQYPLAHRPHAIGHERLLKSTTELRQSVLTSQYAASYKRAQIGAGHRPACPQFPDSGST